MPAVEVWDTNVFRNIGAGDLSLDKLRQSGAKAVYSPVTPLELASKYTEGSFDHRRAAARAILDSGAEVLPDPELHLTRLFGLPPAEDGFDWTHAVKAMANSSDLAELQKGVADHHAGVRRTVNVGFARAYCEGVEGDFVTDMLGIQRSDVPGFAEWFDKNPRKGSVPRLAGKAREVFLAGTQSPMFAGDLMFACMRRATFKSAENLPWPPNEEWVGRLVGASSALEFYCSIYTQYVVRLLAGGMLPKANDWFDLEIMMYSMNDDQVVVTSDQKWASMATEAGMPQRVRVP